jgi:hypothetical protein
MCDIGSKICDKSSDIDKDGWDFPAFEMFVMSFGMMVVVQHGGANMAGRHECEAISNSVGISRTGRNFPCHELLEAAVGMRHSEAEMESCFHIY